MPARTFTIPKPGGGLRTMTELAAHGAAAWRRLARAAAPAVEAALGPEVLANRWLHGPARLAPFRTALRGARARARGLGASAEVLVRTDVRAFYGSVEPGRLERALAAAGVDRRVRAEAGRLLDRWSAAGVRGLPVGPEPSALFANAVLVRTDAALREADIAFLRWVDDYVLDPGRREPEDALAVLDESLDACGLERHPEKTSTEAGWSAPWPGGAYRTAVGTIPG